MEGFKLPEPPTEDELEKAERAGPDRKRLTKEWCDKADRFMAALEEIHTRDWSEERKAEWRTEKEKMHYRIKRHLHNIKKKRYG